MSDETKPLSAANPETGDTASLRGDPAQLSFTCVRCGAPYLPHGQCSRFREGCQGGSGEAQQLKTSAAELALLERRATEAEEYGRNADQEKEELTAELTASQERERKLRAELKVRPFDPGFPSVPEQHRSRRAAYDSGYSAGWRGQDSSGSGGYTSIYHIIAYNAGYTAGEEESAAEIERVAATPEGTVKP